MKSALGSSDSGDSPKNPNFPMEFTYHRHSEEKNMIYFRCSDKNCKARVLFSKDTCKFTLKNRHLSPSSHKPNSRRAITGQQMAKIASLVKGPISLSEFRDENIFFCDSSNLSSGEVKVEDHLKDNYLVRVTCDSMNKGKKLCRQILKKADIESTRLWSVNNGESCAVEVETCSDDKEYLIGLLKDLTGQEQIECFRRI